MPIKLAIFQTHPIQYFAPLWRQLAREPGLDTTVFYLSDSSLRGGVDSGFGRSVSWDVPLLDGYRSVFLKRDTNPARRWDMRLERPRHLLQQGGFQCVLVPGYAQFFEWQVLWAARSLGLGVVMRGEFGPSETANPLKVWLRSRFLNRLYPAIDAFALVGAQARAHLLGHGVSQDRLVFSPYAVDASLFQRRAKSAALKKSLGLGPKDRVALFSGKLIDRKSPQTLIQALALLPDLPHLKAVFLGDGPLAPDLKALAQRLAPGRSVFPGFVNQSKLADYFSLADVFVLPSLFETWGLVVNEAMHMGLPILASDRVGCVPDLVLPGRTGEVFQAGNAQQLAQHLRRLILEPDRRRRYGVEALSLIKRYSVVAAAKGITQAARLSLNKTQPY